MEKPKNWEEVEPANIIIKKPVAGAYVLTIVSAVQGFTKISGEEVLKLEFDIGIGEFRGYYSELSRVFKKPSYLKHSQLITNPSALPYLKRLIEIIEASNEGFIFNWSESNLIGKKIGAVLRDVEYLNKNGDIKTYLNIAYFVDVNTALTSDIHIPPVKKLAVKDENNMNDTSNNSNELPF